ncbi:hypothetical protein BV22DRAFT_1024009, partial [Leucogyrophana mollusca]
MPEGPTTTNDSLHIWQQNVNGSLAAQEHIINGPWACDWDMVALQEPYMNHLHNTRSSRAWRAVYPTNHFTHPENRTRAVTLISAKLDTNHWTQIPFPSSDVVVIQLTGQYGKCTIFNIYNDGKSQSTL